MVLSVDVNILFQSPLTNETSECLMDIICFITHISVEIGIEQRQCGIHIIFERVHPTQRGILASPFHA